MVMYLKKEDGQEYGPVGLDVLKRWAAQGRVEPSDKVSADRDSWKPAPEYSELGMDWVVNLEDGQQYGPVNVFALVGLLEDRILTPDTEVQTKDQTRKSAAGEILLTAMIERYREIEAITTPDRGEPVEESTPSGAEDAMDENTPRAVDEVLRANAALEQETARYRLMYEQVREELKQREAGAQQDQDDAHAAADDTEDAEDSGIANLSAAELRQRLFAARKDARKWRTMYENQRKDMREKEDQLHEQLEAFRVSETEMRKRLQVTARRLAALEANYDKLVHAAEAQQGGDGIALAGQLGGLMQAYTDLSQSYETLFAQLEQRERDVAAADEARRELERVADERFTEMEELIYKEQKSAEAAREQLTALQTSYEQLVRSYRSMNDRYVAWRQRLPLAPQDRKPAGDTA